MREMGVSEKSLVCILSPAFWSSEAIGCFSPEELLSIRPWVNSGYRPQAEKAEPSLVQLNPLSSLFQTGQIPSYRTLLKLPSSSQCHHSDLFQPLPLEERAEETLSLTSKVVMGDSSLNVSLHHQKGHQLPSLQSLHSCCPKLGTCPGSQDHIFLGVLEQCCTPSSNSRLERIQVSATSICQELKQGTGPGVRQPGRNPDSTIYYGMTLNMLLKCREPQFLHL